MRCPKCQYISFDSGDRCRNCGYDFSLSVDVKSLDLEIQNGDEPIGPLADLNLSHLDADAHAPGGVSARNDPPASAPEPPSAARRPQMTSPLDLPLFGGPTDDDTPLVTPPAVPRPPLSVRRTTAPVVRPKPRAALREEPPTLDLATAEPEVTPVQASTTQPGESMAAPLGRRLLGAAIDMAILGAIDLTILYFTLELCGLRAVEIPLVPVIPFGAFVLLLNGSYFVAFTAAGGQTIGKMAAGIRVVPCHVEDGSNRVPFGFSVLRAAAYLVSVVPAGVGFIPAVLGADHRALHDRLAETRVVRA